jgi:hypothetical protein
MNPTPPENPPPVPTGQKSFAHHAALWSVLLPSLAIVICIIVRTSQQQISLSPLVEFVVGGIVGILLLGGIALAIVGLAGIPRHGARGILSKSIAGLVVNGAFLLIFGTGVMVGINRGIKSRQAARDVHQAANDVQASVRDSFDAKHGITNVDQSRLDRLQSEFTNAARTLSGDDALIMQAMAAHTGRMKSALKNYEAAANELKHAEVLRADNLTDKSQFAPRRQLVSHFISANDELKQVIVTGEQNLKTDLTKLRVAQNKIDDTLAGYRAKAGPRNVLTQQIRECDDRIGQSLTGMLEILETQWGNWSVDPNTRQLRIQNVPAREAYNKYFAEIQTASTDQVKAQQKLVNLPP